MIGYAESTGRQRRIGGTRPVKENHFVPRQGGGKGRVLVVEDDELVRDAIGPLLELHDYDVSFADNGREALTYLKSHSAPDIIMLDLRMPVMNGWEFRTIQKDDPKWGLIPVVAISADGSAQAAAISADAYLRKPVDPDDLIATIERVLVEKHRQILARMGETERLAALGRMAAGVGHEINNPLAFVMMNLTESIKELRPWIRGAGVPSVDRMSDVDLATVNMRLADVSRMLEDCMIGSERIRSTVSNLQRLSGKIDDHRGPVDLHQIIEQSVSMVWNQIRHRARLIKSYGTLPSIVGNSATLGQVFLNLLVNAAQAIPEGDAAVNEIRISSKVVQGPQGAEIVVEISDSGKGIRPESLPHVFEPFYTTKAMGQGTGLGLSISRQTIIDHGGRISVSSEPGQGAVFRVCLPIIASAKPVDPLPTSGSDSGVPGQRILVIDDEPQIGTIIRRALKSAHTVSVVQRAADALTLLEQGQRFDLVLCDVVMPDLTGPEFYATVMKRWPQIGKRMIFMTGGAFTPKTAAFMQRIPTRVLAKPFTIDGLKGLVREIVGRSD